MDRLLAILASVRSSDFLSKTAVKYTIPCDCLRHQLWSIHTFWCDGLLKQRRSIALCLREIAMPIRRSKVLGPVCREFRASAVERWLGLGVALEGRRRPWRPTPPRIHTTMHQPETRRKSPSQVEKEEPEDRYRSIESS